MSNLKELFDNKIEVLSLCTLDSIATGRLLHRPKDKKIAVMWHDYAIPIARDIVKIQIKQDVKAWDIYLN
jgi:hypothetical protein